MPRHQLTGKVVSNKMNKTVVVEVEIIKQHPKYKRRYKFHTRYKAHDEKGEYKPGDEVIIEEFRPISKEKRWQVVKKIGERKDKGIDETFEEAMAPLRETGEIKEENKNE